MTTVDAAREALLDIQGDDYDFADRLDAFEAAIRAEYEGTTAERVWAALEADPDFVVAMEQGQADLAAGRFREWNDIRAESAETLAALREAAQKVIDSCDYVDGTAQQMADERKLDALRAALAATPAEHPVWAGTGTCPYCGIWVPAATPAEDDPRSITLHPGQHEFRTTCRLCGEDGMLHVSLITHHERVTISDPRATPAEDEEGRT